MITILFSPWGIPATYRHMQGSGVNTYKWVNAEGEAVLVKYHWEPKQGIRNLTQEEADAIQAKNVSHATQDLYEAIERGDYPEWELFVQMMEDDYHPELDFDPLDDTKLWPEDQFPWLPVGRMVLIAIQWISMRRLSNPPLVQGFLSMEWISPTIKCFKVVPSLTPIHSVTV